MQEKDIHINVMQDKEQLPSSIENTWILNYNNIVPAANSEAYLYKSQTLKKFTGTSSDIKPILALVGSEFYEIDTRYTWFGISWQQTLPLPVEQLPLDSTTDVVSNLAVIIEKIKYTNTV